MPHPRFWLPMVFVSIVAVSSSSAGVDPSPPISKGDKVTISFNLLVPETRFAIKDNVSEYVPGDSQLVPGLERELMGMKPGEKKHVELGPEESFGRYEPDKRMTVERERLPEQAKIGDVYKTAHGQPFMVQDLADRQAVIDFNHPLAGKRVVFDVQVLKVERQGNDSQEATSTSGAQSDSGQAPGAEQDATIMTFTGATVESVDPEGRKVGVRTQQGENWSLEVTRNELLKDLKEGDRVSLELNSNDRVKNIIRTDEGK